MQINYTIYVTPFPRNTPYISSEFVHGTVCIISRRGGSTAQPLLIARRVWTANSNDILFDFADKPRGNGVALSRERDRDKGRRKKERRGETRDGSDSHLSLISQQNINVRYRYVFRTRLASPTRESSVREQEDEGSRVSPE